MSIITYELKTHIAQQFKESITEPANTMYYMVLGKSTAWPDDNNPPAETQSVKYNDYDLYREAICGKLVSDDDVKLMAKRYDWVANTVYTMYDDQTIDLSQKNFYVVVTSLVSSDVFKCINNNGGVPSTVAPSRDNTSEDDIFYQTSDGYQWKYLYSFTINDYNKFAATNYIPIFENANTTANAVSGALETFVVSIPGASYNSYTDGYFQQTVVGGDALIHTIEPTASANTDFYSGCAIKIVEGTGLGQIQTISDYIVSGGQRRIVLTSPFEIQPDTSSKYEITPAVIVIGDGSGFKGRAIVNTVANSINYIEVVDRGQNYTWADVTLVANTGDIFDTSKTANVRAIISPPGGHGSNISKELYCTGVGISIAFANTELGTIPTTNTFRTIGLIKNPQFANVELSLANVEGTFVDAETITELVDNAAGIVTFYDDSAAVLRLTNVVGSFDLSGSIVGNSSNAAATIVGIKINGITKDFNTFDQRTRMNINLTANTTFDQNEYAIQSGTNAQGIVHEANSSFLALTNAKGTFNITDVSGNYTVVGNTTLATANVISVIGGDIITSTGDLIYVENVQPITRKSTHTELIKLVIEF